MRARRTSFLCWWLIGSSLAASAYADEFDRFKTSCSKFNFGGIASCGELLFTDHPLHIAFGSLAPQNGIGFGGAYVGHWTTANWRNSWSVDAVGSSNGSWRAGGYLTLVWSKVPTVVVTRGRGSGTGSAPDASIEQPVFHLYSETTSLNKIDYFGLGPSTKDTARSYFGMRETVTGGNAIWPVASWHPLSGLKLLNLSLIGEANGRFVDIRPSTGQSSPSIEQLYSDATAPGLTSQPAFAQFGQAARLRPTFANGYIRLNYLVNFQEYVATGNSKFSFERFTTDLSHQFPLYKTTTRTLLPHDFNGPDQCAESADDTDHKCPPILRPSPPGKTRNLEGSVGIRFLLSESITPSGHLVPFYFQPTLGGSDINGNAALGSYQDYRFRAPNLLLVRASFEHSIYHWPIGILLMIDEGKVTQNRSDIDFSHLVHSYSAGLTLRAGGFPMVQLLFSWGGHEGMHTTGSVNTSLLGGSARPSLY